MPDSKDKIDVLHKNLIQDGYELPDINGFRKSLSNPESIQTLHKNLIEDGYELPDINLFKRDIGFGVDFKTPKYQENIEKPKSTSIFGEMPGPTIAVSESTKGQNLKQEEFKRVEVEEGLQQIYKKNKEERVKKVKSEALKNTTKRALEADKIAFVEGDSNWISKQNDIQDHVENESLILTNDIYGNPLYKRSLGPLDSFVEAVSQTYTKEKKAAKFSSDSTLDRIKTAEEEATNLVESEAVPGGISGKVGEFFGGAAEIVGKAIIGARTGAMIGSTVAPGYGTTIGGITGAFIAMAPSSMEVGFTDETIKRYNETISKLEESNKFTLKKITQQEKIDAMNDAVSQGRVAAGVEAAKVLSLSLMPGSAGVAAEKGFTKAMGNFIKHTAYGAGEFAKVSAGGGLMVDMSAKLKGYNVTTADAFDNIFPNASEGAKTALAFSVAHGSLNAVSAIPKYVKSSAFNYMSNIENSSIISYGMAQEKNGILPEGSTQKIILELDKYKDAKELVPINLQTNENAGSFVGHIQKKINLENIKKQTDPAFHPEIDKKIEQVNLKIQELMKSPDPVIEEVDHLTGDTGEALPFTEKELIAAEQNLEPIAENQSIIPQETVNVETEVAPITTKEVVDPQQVQEKIKDVFPNTTVEAILYHDSNIDNISEFKDSENGIFVTGDENWWQQGKNKYAVAVDIKNPKIISTPLNSIITKEFFSNPENNQYDSIVTTGTSGDMSKAVYAVRNASQTKILGASIDGKIEITTTEKVPIKTESQPIAQEGKTVEQLRAEEQKEYDAIDPNDEVKKKEIYDKYDKLITPLLEKEAQIKDANIDALNETIKGTEYENDARSAGLREQVTEGVAGEVPRTTETRVAETADIAKYKPEQQQFITETREKLGGEEQARQLYEKEGLQEYGQTYENFLLEKGCI